MNYKHTLEAAKASLVEIDGLLQAFQDSGHISAIEIDLVMQKTRNFYDVLLLLKSGDNKKIPPDHPGKVSVSEPGPAKVEEPQSEKSLTSVEDSFEMIPESPQAGEALPTPVRTKTGGKKVLSDSIHGKATLGDSLHQNIQYQDMASRLHGRPVSDLAKAIGINERFLYIRELFANDSKKYENAVEVLNSAANFNEAYNYMIREFAWDMDSELVQGLLDVVRRKFITGQHE